MNSVRIALADLQTVVYHVFQATFICINGILTLLT